MANKKTTQEIAVKIDFKGLEKIQAAQSKLKEGSTAFNNIASFIAMLQEMRKEINMMKSGGYLESANRMARGINKAINSTNKAIADGYLVTARGAGYSGFGAYSANSQRNIAKASEQSIFNMQRVRANNAGDIFAVKNSEKEIKLSRENQKLLAEDHKQKIKFSNEYYEEQSKKIEELDKKNRQAFHDFSELKRKEQERLYREQAARGAKFVAEEDAAQYKKHKESVADLLKADESLHKNRIAQSKTEIEIEKIRKRGVDLSVLENNEFANKAEKLREEERILGNIVSLRKVQVDEAKKALDKSSPETFESNKENLRRLTEAHELAKQHLDLTKQSRKEEEKIQKSIDKANIAKKGFLGALKDSVKEFFSMEKLVARISFVLTAKFSYDIMNMVTRLPKQMLESWKNFQDEITKTFALLASESETTKKKLERDVRSLAREYGASAKEIAGALYEVISAQVGVANAANVLERAIQLSISGGSDVRTAAKALVQIANAYGMSFDKVGRIADLAFQTVKYGQLTIQQYTDQMSKVISTASILKIPIEEVSAAISTMTINGINADQAFTALNQMFMKIATPTSEAKKLMAELGIDLSIAKIQTEGLEGALRELVPLLNMTGESQEQLITILFKNRTGFKAVASLLSNMEEYAKNYYRMIDAVEAAQEGLAARTNTVAFAQNKMNAAWEEMKMQWAGGYNREIISFYDTIAHTINILIKNIPILTTLIKGLSVLVIRGLLVKLISHLKILQGQIVILGHQFSITWAKATAGLSLILTALAEISIAIAHIQKSVVKKDISESLGLKELENDSENASREINNLQHELDKFDGIELLVKRWEALNKVQDKNSDQIASMDKLYGEISKRMQDVGVNIAEMTRESESFMEHIKKMREMQKNLREDVLTQNTIGIREDLMSTIAGISEGAKYGYKIPYIGTQVSPPGGRAIMNRDQYFRAVATDKRTADIEYGKQIDLYQIYEGERRVKQNIEFLQGLIKKKDYETTYTWAEDMQEWYEDEKKKIDKEIEVLSNKETLLPLEEISLKNKQVLSDIYATAIASSLDIRKLTYPMHELPDFEPTIHGEEKTEKSFLSNAESLLSSMFGDVVYEDIEQLREAMLEKIEKIRKDMAKHKKTGTIIDEAETKALLEQMEKMTNLNAYMQIISEADKAFGEFMNMAKSSRSVGNEQESKKWIEKAHNTFQSFNQAIKEVSSLTVEEIMKSTGANEEDAKTLLREFKKAAFDNVYNYLSGYKDILTPEEYASIVFSVFGLDEPETLEGLNKMIAELEGSGMDELGSAAELLKTKMLDGLQEALNAMFDIFEPSDVFQILDDVIGNAISEIEEPTDNQKRNVIARAISKTEEGGASISQKEKEKLYAKYIPEKESEDKGLSWKKMFGIEDYEDGNDATIDVANKTVSTLKDVWSFYWNWEQEQLQRQTDKKLSILEHEKDVMLANTNMSEEQKLLINEKYAERARLLQEEQAKKMAKMKKKQAVFNASIDLARGLIGIWSSELSKGPLGLATAPVLTGMLTAIFAAQMAMIQNQKFASGGLTGSGYGSPDETGYRPAGIVHEGELVIDKDTLDKNYNQLTGMYSALKSGSSFDDYLSKYLSGSIPIPVRPNQSGSFASGGLVGSGGQFGSIQINLNGARVLDPIELNRIVEIGGKKRRKLNA